MTPTCAALASDAPPAFLLDARRRTGEAFPGAFDNRSINLPTDFPSAEFLLHRGIGRALLVQERGGQPQADLAHTLRRWQAAGIAIDLKRLDEQGPPVPIQVARPTWYGWLWYNLFATLGLRGHPLGGYGGLLPVPSAG